MKTGSQIQGDIIHLIMGSSLPSQVSGDVYRRGNRPRDSRLEDIVVSFTAGLAEQIESGVVTVNIYVPDIDCTGDGVLVEDGARTAALEAAAQIWAESLTASRSNYKFRLQQTIYTEEEEETRQHFVVIKLHYDFFANN